MGLIVLGTVALDNIKTPSGTRRNMLGGSAAHFCMAARFFTKVNLAAVIGEDFPRKYIQFLKEKGIHLTSLKTEIGGKTFRWHGEYKKEDFNTALTLATELGVLSDLTIPRLSESEKSIPNVFLANIDPDIQLGLLQMMRAPRLIGVDSMNLWINHKRASLLKLLKRADLFVANDGEARMLSSENNLIQAAKVLRKMGPKFIVIKKGEHGMLFHSDSIRFSFPAYPVGKIVDPTGAGDTFAGGLMGYLSRSQKINKAVLKKAVVYATTIASFNVEGFGMAKTAGLTMSVIHKRRKEYLEFISC